MGLLAKRRRDMDPTHDSFVRVIFIYSFYEHTLTEDTVGQREREDDDDTVWINSKTKNKKTGS